MASIGNFLNIRRLSRGYITINLRSPGASVSIIQSFLIQHERLSDQRVGFRASPGATPPPGAVSFCSRRDDFSKMSSPNRPVEERETGVEDDSRLHLLANTSVSACEGGRGLPLAGELPEILPLAAQTRPSELPGILPLTARTRPSELPEIFWDKILAMHGQDVMLVLQKRLVASDVNRKESRLAMPSSQILADFLSPKEIRDLDDKKSIPVSIIEPCLEVCRDLELRKRKNSGESFSYVFTRHWNAIAHPFERNGLRKDSLVRLWSFRAKGDLHFCLVNVEAPEPFFRSTHAWRLLLAAVAAMENTSVLCRHLGSFPLKLGSN